MPNPSSLPREEPATAGDEMFRPVNPAAVPELGGVIAWLAQHDPDVLGAVAEFDRSFIWATMELAPRERLHQGIQIGLDLEELAQNLRQQRALKRAG